MKFMAFQGPKPNILILNPAYNSCDFNFINTSYNPEYFALFVMAFATLGGVASKNQAKTVLASCLGLGIATIGVDHQTGVPRMSYEIIELYDGIDFLVVIVGLFAVSEVFVFIEKTNLKKT
jgi:TctA family transporter